MLHGSARGCKCYLQTGSFEEALATVLAEVGPLVVVLLPVEDGGVPVAELSTAVLALVYLAHPVRGQVLLQIGRGSKGFLTKLALPGFALIVNSLYVDPHVVSSHKQLGAVRTGHTRSTFFGLLLGGCSTSTGLDGVLHLGGSTGSHRSGDVFTDHKLTGLYPAVVDHCPAVDDWDLLPGLESDAGHGLLHCVGLHYVHLVLLLMVLLLLLLLLLL